jgi:hypothetical protein
VARRRTHPDISLFPFLSVLCSVIGVLLLFIVLVLSTRVIAEEERYEETLEYRRPRAPGMADALEGGIDQRSFAELEAEIHRLTDLLQVRLEKRDALTRKMQALEDLIEYKKTEFLIPAKITRPVEFDKPVPVAIVPDQGYKNNLRPIFVVVSDEGYVVQPSKQSFPAIKQDQSTKTGPPKKAASSRKSDAVPAGVDPGLAKYLRGLNPNKEYLVFLIQPNGVAAFDEILTYVQTKHKELRFGFEPFARNWVFANEPDGSETKK